MNLQLLKGEIEEIADDKEFLYYEGCDSIGYDLFKADTENLNQLKCICRKSDKCVVFNSLGYMKYFTHDTNIKPLSYFNNQPGGLYVHIRKYNELLQRKKLIFYVGYADFNKTHVTRSKIALVNLCKSLTPRYEIYIFGQSCEVNVRDDVLYLDCSSLNTLMNNTNIDVLVVVRYVHYFIEYPVNAKKVYIWADDETFDPGWRNNLSFPQTGRNLVVNMIHKIDQIVTVSEWNRTNYLQKYDMDKYANKIKVIGNGLNNEDFSDEFKIAKVPYRFIYISSADRGLGHLVEYFEDIRKEFPLAELYVFTGLNSFAMCKSLLDTINTIPYIHYKGKLGTKELMNELLKAEMWVYPTEVCETYCMSALEAMRAGCYCITNSLAGLKNTVGDRGALIEGNPREASVKLKYLEAVREAFNNEDLRQEVQQRGMEWACKQTWESVGNQWMELIGDD